MLAHDVDNIVKANFDMYPLLRCDALSIFATIFTSGFCCSRAIANAIWTAGSYRKVRIYKNMPQVLSSMIKLCPVFLFSVFHTVKIFVCVRILFVISFFFLIYIVVVLQESALVLYFGHVQCIPLIWLIEFGENKFIEWANIGYSQGKKEGTRYYNTLRYGISHEEHNW